MTNEQSLTDRYDAILANSDDEGVERERLYWQAFLDQQIGIQTTAKKKVAIARDHLSQITKHEKQREKASQE